MGRRKGIFGRSKDSNNDRKKNQGAISNNSASEEGKRNSSSSSNSRRSSSIASGESDISPKTAQQQQQQQHHEKGERPSPKLTPTSSANKEQEVKEQELLLSSSLVGTEAIGSSRSAISTLPVVSEDKLEASPVETSQYSSNTKHQHEHLSNNNLKNMKIVETEGTLTDDGSAQSRNSNITGPITEQQQPIGMPYLMNGHTNTNTNADSSMNRSSSMIGSSTPQPNQGSNPYHRQTPPSFIPSGQLNPQQVFMPNIFVTRLPPVSIAIEEVWRSDVNDFQSGVRALKLLYRSIENEGHYNSGRTDFSSYDPSELFMCVKNITERYRSHWVEVKNEQMEKERMFQIRQKQLKRKEEENKQAISQKSLVQKTLSSNTIKEIAENSVDEDPQTEGDASENTKNIDEVIDNNSKTQDDASETNFSVIEEPLSEEDWLQIDQMTWEIWELSFLCIASLAKLCVGPAWDHQLQQRQRRILSQQQSMRQQSLDKSNHSISTLGLDSFATSARRSYTSRPISFSNTHQIEEDVQYSPVSSTGTNPQSAASSRILGGLGIHEENKYPRIPEVLPAAMLRFAAEFGDSIVGPIHSPNSSVHLTLNKNASNKESDDVIDLNNYSECIMKMIWSEQRSLIRRQRIGESQRELATALFGFSPFIHSDNNSVYTSQSNRSERKTLSDLSESFANRWNIPGAHAPVATMIRGWVETAVVGWPAEQVESDIKDDNAEATSQHLLPSKLSNFTRNPSNSHQIMVLWGSISKNGATDWWYSYQVTKVVFDLVNVGWRPPPHGRNGDEGILGLLALAEKGIMLNVNDMRYPKEETIEEAREERIAAASSAAEAMSTLSSLSTRGLLPASTITPVSSSLCRLLAAANPSISNIYDTDLFPLNPELSLEEKDLLEEQGAFIAQRESSLKDTAEMTWTMLAHFSSMSMSADALLNAIARFVSLGTKSKTQRLTKDARSESGKASFDDHALSACGAIRALGASLWGNPPQVKGIPSLRIYWNRFLRLLAETSSSLHDWSLCDVSPLDRPTVVSSSNSFSGSRRSVSSVDSRGIDSFKTIPPLAPLSEYEPAVLVLVLETALALRRLVDGEMREGTGNLSPHEFFPFISLLEQSFLPWLAPLETDDINDEKDSSLNFFRNMSLAEKIQTEVLGIFNQVQNFLAVKGNSISTQIIDENARRRMHLLYFRMVSPLLHMEDSIYVNISVIDSWVCGGAVSHRGRDWQKKCADLMVEAFAVYEDRSHGFPGGYVHAPIIRRVAIRSFVDTADSIIVGQSEQSTRSVSDIDPQAVARYARNIHLEPICSVMFPFLMEILLDGKQRNGLVLHNPIHNRYRFREDTNNCDLPNGIQSAEEDQYALQKTAIQIVGDLLLSDIVDRHNKTKLIELLREFLGDVPSFFPQTGGEDKDVFKSHDQMISSILTTLNQASVLKLEAISQLGFVFEASFERLAQLHSLVPNIVQVFNEVLVTYNVAVPTSGMRVVSLAAIFQLSRLKMSRSKRAMIVDEMSILNSLPPTTATTVSWMKGLMNSINSSNNYHEINIDSGKDKDEVYHGKEIHVAPFLKIDHLETQHEETPGHKSSRSRQLGSSLNLRPLLETMRKMFHYESEGDKAINDYVNSSATYSLDSELRTISYEMLSSFILSGIITTPIDQWNEHVCSPKATYPSQSEIISRSKLLYCFAGFASCSNDGDQLNVLFREILTCCSSDDVLESSNGCRALSIFLSTASLPNSSFNNKQEMNEDNLLWGQEACDTLLARIQQKVNNLEIDGSDEIEKEVSALVPLLSALFDILSAYHLNASLSDRVKAKIVIISIQICSTFDEKEETAQTFLICLQCSATAISSMTSEEMKKLLSHVSDRRTISRETESQIVDIIFNLLIQRNMEQHVYKQSDGAIANETYKKLLTANGCIAADNEEIESFVVSNDDSNSAAWRYGDMVLTCRIGAQQSRYRGWVELIVRSPCTRVRRLIKLSGHTSLCNPNFPSPLWDRLSTAKGKKEKALSSFVSEEVKTADTQIISLGKDAARRFDMMTQKIERNDLRNSEPSTSFHTDNLRMFLGLDLEDQVIEKIKKESSRQDQQPLSNIDNNRGNDSSVRLFLNAALNGNEDDIIEVENEINRLDGASSSELDSFYAQNEEMRKLKNSPQLRRAVAILDRAAFLQTHKIALLFMGASSTGRKESKGKRKDADNGLLNAINAPPSFSQFCNGLGDLTPLPHLRHFSGGLDTSDYASDGNFALSWIGQESENAHDLTGKIMVLFHSVPLMPPGVNNRKRHVGNDVVHIVYIENSEVPTFDNSDRSQCDISGEFCFVTIFVTPSLYLDMVKVSVTIRKDLDEKIMRTLQHLALTHMLIPKAVAPFHVRQIAIRADLSCRSVMQDRLGLFSNWQERLQQIRELERYVEK